VDPRGTGITSGLDDGRVRKKVGGGLRGQDILNYAPNNPYFKSYSINPYSIYTPSYETDDPTGFNNLLRAAMFDVERYEPVGKAKNISESSNLTDYYQSMSENEQNKSEDMNNLYASLNDTATDATTKNVSDIDDIEGVAGDSPGLGSAMKNSVTGFKDYTDFIKSIAEEKLQKREKGNMIKPPNETEISQEDIIDSIFKERVAKAKRGDIADVLGGAAEGFLTGGLREGLVGATRASRTPGRAEQLENTLASLKVQDKLGQAKEARTQKFELEKLEKALKGQEKIAALKGPALSDYGKKRNELTAQGFDSNTADRIARGGYANLDELMIAKPDLPLRQFETAVRYIYGENSVKGKLTEEELKDQTLLNNLDPGIYIVDKQRTIVDTRSGKVNTIRY